MNRIHEELKKLATFSSTEVPAITRILYTDKDLEARDYFIGLCEEIDLKVTTDAIGNIFARWEGSDATLPAVATGSHIDAIPLSGMYDGTVGVFGGLAAIRTLKNEGYKPTRSIELILFTSEEPTRFKIGCLGSRMLGGQMKTDDVLKLKDDKGESFDDVRKKAGYTSKLSEVELSKNHYKAFVELHIEQGPILEKEDLDIGIVTKIAAPSSLKITLTGEGGHAGAVLMENRKDAGVAGAEVMIAVEQVAKESESKDTVATVGIFDVTPRAVNSIPKEVYMEVDLRGTSVTARDFALNKLQEDIKVICEKRNILYDIKMVNCDPPAICDTDLVNTVENVSNQLGFKSKRMISRAYHDTLFMALVVPTTMIFIPCRDGVSHRPDEYSSPTQIEKGVETLKNTLKTLTIS